MKKKILLILIPVLLFMLWGCGAQMPSDNRISVALEEKDGCVVENNGQWIQPGEDVVFLLDLENGVSLASTDYAGNYSTVMKDGKLELTLENVQYPALVKLDLTNRYSTITYMPNGGVGEERVNTYSLEYHIRPNTDIGTGKFSREGHTLVSWNTEPDGSGTRVGLGSRVSAGPRLTLYAQWAPWTPAEDFTYTLTEFDHITIDSYLGTDETVVIPEMIDGYEVTVIAAGAFDGSTVKHIVLPSTIDQVESGAFVDCPLETVTLFDNIQVISDDSFQGCENLRTLYINAIEAPWGYDYRKESVYADKVDMLMAAQGEKKLVFYAGCSVWYNLDGYEVHRIFGKEYTVINMGLNGTTNSTVQMQIMAEYLEEGDVLLHTLELSSKPQLLVYTDMGERDDKLWCGLEYNWDLFTLVDLRTVDGEFSSLVHYLEMKEGQTTYVDVYMDDQYQMYLDEYGCIPFYRGTTERNLADGVRLDPAFIDETGLANLESYYDRFQELGVTVYVSYACVNMDEVPEDQQGNVELMDSLVKAHIGAMGDVAVISNLSDFLFVHDDFYDTNYHLLSRNVIENTKIWIRDLKAQMVIDGLWEDAE